MVAHSSLPCQNQTERKKPRKIVQGRLSWLPQLTQHHQVTAVEAKTTAMKWVVQKLVDIFPLDWPEYTGQSFGDALLKV